MGMWLIRISVIYLFIGTAVGMYMSITEDFGLSSLHTHILLMGWTTMTLAGLIYHIFPTLTRSVLCRIVFISLNIGVPFMMIGLIYLKYIAIVSAGATITSIAILIFTVHILTGLRKSSDERLAKG